MNRAALPDLITALESATGPSRELDARIWLAIGGRIDPVKERGGHKHERWYDAKGKRVPVNWETYFTGSIDAARALIPEAHTWAGGNLNEDNVPWACVTSLSGKDYQGAAFNEATALCIAALRARA